MGHLRGSSKCSKMGPKCSKITPKSIKIDRFSCQKVLVFGPQNDQNRSKMGSKYRFLGWFLIKFRVFEGSELDQIAPGLTVYRDPSSDSYRRYEIRVRYRPF